MLLLFGQLLDLQRHVSDLVRHFLGIDLFSTDRDVLPAL
jgi:hypothetical protein